MPCIPNAREEDQYATARTCRAKFGCVPRYRRYHSQTDVSPRGNSRFEHGSVIVHNIFACLALSLSALQMYMIHERCWFLPNGLFFEYFPHRINVLFIFRPIFMSSTYTDKNNPFSRCTNKHSQLKTFSPPYFNRIFSNLPFP